MTTEERIKAQWELVESISRMYEKKGFGMIPGRVIGLLSVMDKEQYTFDEIVDELKVSKSSASNALKILEVRDMIEYTTIPNDRKRYFKLKTQDKFALIDEHKLILQGMCKVFQNIIDLKASKDTGNSVFFQDIVNMISVFLEKFEELKTNYLNRH